MSIEKIHNNEPNKPDTPGMQDFVEQTSRNLVKSFTTEEKGEILVEIAIECDKHKVSESTKKTYSDFFSQHPERRTPLLECSQKSKYFFRDGIKAIISCSEESTDKTNDMIRFAQETWKYAYPFAWAYYTFRNIRNVHPELRPQMGEDISKIVNSLSDTYDHYLLENFSATMLSSEMRDLVNKKPELRSKATTSIVKFAQMGVRPR